MENGASILKKLGIIFLCIGTLGVSGSLILCFIVPSLWLFSFIFGSVLAVFLIVGIICMIIYSTNKELFLQNFENKKGKKEKLIANGKYIYADIVDIDVNVYQKVQIDRISMNPYFIVCKYVEANGKEYLFKSKSLLYNPSALIKEKQLKVYVDLKNPKKYYVDTSSILPDSAVLHKFKFDSRGKERALLKEGNYINAVTCGVELVGRIKVNSIVKPMFLKVTDSLSEQFKTPVDEKNRAFMGYTVLCRYDAPDGKIHIFASRGQWGEPQRDYQGENVRVYYSGKNYESYHVDLNSIGL